MSAATNTGVRGVTRCPASCSGHTTTPDGVSALGVMAGSVGAALDICGIVRAVSGIVGSTATRALARAVIVGSGFKGRKWKNKKNIELIMS